MSFIVFMLSLIGLSLAFITGYVVGYDKGFEDGRKNRRGYIK